jgi:shikimate kinase
MPTARLFAFKGFFGGRFIPKTVYILKESVSILSGNLLSMTEDYRSNIILIGMPGSGKSTVGVILAKLTSKGFIDTDLLIQSSEGRALQEIVDADGYLELRRIEERILLGIDVRDYVIATGGSAVYSRRAMERLAKEGIIIFLDADLATLQTRVSDFASRGLAKRPEQSFADLFEERVALYRKYAEITINCSGLNHEEACAEIAASLGEAMRSEMKRH